jgi:PmbA protein
MSILSQQSNLYDALDFLLKFAKNKGADAIEVDGFYGKNCDIQVRMGQVERLEFHQEKSISLTVFKGEKKASASTTDFNRSALEDIVNKACLLAEYTQADPYQGLADKGLLAWDYPDLDLYHPSETEPEKRIHQLIETEQYALSLDKRITNSEGTSFSASEHLIAYANSHGFIGSYPTTEYSFSCSLLAEELGKRQRDYDYTVSRRASDLSPFKDVATIAAELTLKRLNPRTLKTQEAPVIFSARLARGLLGHLLSAISGKNLYMESSFLLHQMNQRIFPTWMDIYEDPFIHRGLASSPFDSDGIMPEQKYLVEEGILKSYLLSVYSARRLGLNPTGNAGGAHNVFVKDSGIDFHALVKHMNQGFIVTELLGHGVDLVTGNYSRGASGFWVEKGEIAYPVEGVTIAGNLKEMFLNIDAIANDIDRRGKIQTGSLLIPRMTIAGGV